MNLRGKIKIITDIMCRNWILPVLLLCMGFIAMYMVDTSMSYYYYQMDIIRQCVEPLREDIDNVFYIAYQSISEEQQEAYARFMAEMEQIPHIGYSGRFALARENISINNDIISLVDAVIAEQSLLPISNLGLTEEEIGKLQNYAGEYCPVMVGANLAEKFPIGTVFSFGYGQDCIVAGVLPEGALWIREGSGKGLIGNMAGTSSMDDKLLLCPKEIESMYMFDAEEAASQRNIYYVCDEIYQEEVRTNIYQKAQECGYAITVVSMGDRVEETKEEYGLADNKQFISAIMLMILAVISMSMAVAATCMLRKNDFGIMYAFGIGIKDIGEMIIMENVFVIVLAGAAAWLIRKGEIFRMYFRSSSKYEEVYVNLMDQRAWNLSHNMITPLILLACGLVMIIASSLIPILLLKKQNPSEMIYQQD